MSKIDYLKEALPAGTRYALRVIKPVPGRKAPLAVNRWHSTVESLAHEAEEYAADGWNAYYSTAGFGAGDEADADNAVAKRELYIDVDCGADKPYKDKSEGLQALKDFCGKLGLPRPTIIDSGNGIHAHWLFKEAIPVHEWKPVAVALKQHCANQQFTVDHTCTADLVRVLRIPDTVNTKGGHTVTVLTPIKQFEFDALKEIIGEAEVPQEDIFKKARALTKAGGGLSETAKLVQNNRVSKFQTIWVKSVKDEGCAQIKNAIENAETLTEPIWRAVLSIAQHCEDRDWGIHEISKDHPNYDASETEAKASLTKGPYTCETFQGLEPSICAGCPHAGMITSPIQLGAEVKAAPSEPRQVVVNGIEYEIPPYPFPFFKADHGGIYQHVLIKDTNERRADLVYPHDLYVFKRMRQVDSGDLIWVRHHMPTDGVREFVITQKELSAIDRFRDKINEQGVIAFAMKQLLGLQALFGKQIEQLQYKERANEMHTRFGWTRDNTFIVGNREYTADGVRHAPVVKNLEPYLPWFKPKGSLEVWKLTADKYNTPAMDLHAFGLLSAFGSVLMHLSPENGGVVNYFSQRSGTGKTTILKMANSVFGDPKAMMKDSQDTAMTKTHRMGVYNGIILCCDEMSNSMPIEISTLLYGSTQGRARDRMKANENTERVNDVTWKGTSIWSSNTSVEDRLSLMKLDPQGEMARLIEIYLATPVPSSVLETQKLFNQLNDNYGHAGDVFLRYVIPNLAEVKAVWEQTRDKVYAMRPWTQTERYRLNTVICGIAAGLITNALGLTNYNIKRILTTIADYVQKAGDEMRSSATGAVGCFAAFINKNVQNILIIEDAVRVNGLQKAASVTPKGPLMIRWETDSKTLYVVQREFNRWCAESFVNAKEMKSLFESETNAPLNLVKKRMGKGWNADFGPVLAYEIKNADKVLGVGVDEIIAARGDTEPTEDKRGRVQTSEDIENPQ